jgi:hypothetical protein
MSRWKDKDESRLSRVVLLYFKSDSFTAEKMVNIMNMGPPSFAAVWIPLSSGQW